MNKSLEAFLRGYVLFDVNGKKFSLYNGALNERRATKGNVQFIGLHIFKGWTTFFLRLDNI